MAGNSSSLVRRNGALFNHCRQSARKALGLSSPRSGKDMGTFGLATDSATGHKGVVDLWAELRIRSRCWREPVTMGPMLLGSVLISGPQWLLPAAAFVVAATLLLWWSYRRAPASPGLRAACVGLKLAGLLALAACLLEPLWTRQRVKPGANFFVVLADNSQGLKIHDRGAAESRGDGLRRMLVGDSAMPWQAKLDENFQVRRYLF